MQWDEKESRHSGTPTSEILAKALPLTLTLALILTLPWTPNSIISLTLNSVPVFLLELLFYLVAEYQHEACIQSDSQIWHKIHIRMISWLQYIWYEVAEYFSLKLQD